MIGTATLQPAAGPALQFDGTSGYVNLGSSDAFNFQANEKFSVSFWINSTNTNQQMIVGKGQGFLGHNSPGWTVFSAYGFLYFQLNAGVEFQSDELQAWDLGTPICDGAWHHVTVTYDGSKTASATHFYIDGAGQTLGTDSDNLWANAVHSHVNATIAGTGYFSGELQQVLIFNTNIGEAEDTDLYNTGAGDYGAAGLTDAPVADYEGDIADGAAADSSGNGNDGTLIGRVTAATGPVAASSDAVATFTTSTLSAGTTPHSLTAVFSGSASNTVSEVVGPDAPAIALTSSTSESVVGQSVSFAAALPSNLGGTLAIKDNGTTLVSDSLVAQSAAALQFSNTSDTSYLTVPASTALDNLTNGSNKQLTLTAWINPASDMDNDGILFKGPLDESQGTISVSFAHGGGSPNQVNFRLNGAVGGAGDGEVVSSTYIPDNQWTFIACTYDGTNEDIYINGVLDASAAYSASLQSDTSGLAIGAYESATDTYSGHYMTFNGQIEEVGVWKQALDADTLAGLFNNGAGERGNTAAAPWNQNFVAGLHCDEGQGTTVADFANSGNSATLAAGGPTWSGGKALDNIVTLATSSLLPGTRTITAVYSGDENYVTSTSSVLDQAIDPSVAITGLPMGESSPTGTPITFGSSVTDASGSPLTPSWYAWTVKDSSGTTIYSGTGSSYTFPAADSGSYSVTLAATVNGAIGTVSLNLAIQAYPLDTLAPQSDCSCSCSCSTGDGADPNSEPNISPTTGASDEMLSSALAGNVSPGLQGFLPDYNSRAADPDWGYGYGWSVSALPTAFASPAVGGVCIAFNTTDTLWFSGSGTSFTPLFGVRKG